MAIIEEDHIEHWFDLTLRIDEYFSHWPNYIFRGQADAEWPLEPTLSRRIKEFYPDSEDTESLSRDLLSSFKSNLRGRCSLDLKNTSDDEFWSLGQHHGLHTPLLDWTRSPFTAVFFSMFGECKSGNRALWAILESDIPKIHENDSTSEPSNMIRVVEPMTHHNERLVSQRGLFIHIPASESLENRVRKLEDQGHVTMYKFNFPDSIRDDALAALSLRNINFASLFPDLEGSSKYTNYIFESEKHFENMREIGWPEP